MSDTDGKAVVEKVAASSDGGESEVKKESHSSKGHRNHHHQNSADKGDSTDAVKKVRNKKKSKHHTNQAVSQASAAFAKKDKEDRDERHVSLSARRLGCVSVGIGRGWRSACLCPTASLASPASSGHPVRAYLSL